MLSDIKEQVLSVMSLKLMAVVLPAIVLSILTAMVMYQLGFPTMVYDEVVLILTTLMHVVLGVWSALNVVLLGIVIAALLFALFLPVLIVFREIQKKRNEPSAASDSVVHSSSNMADATRQ
ncbi:MAG: hypothetical protein ACTHK9_11540 [Nitrobacter sp.]|jgi:fatty acid desaturase